MNKFLFYAAAVFFINASAYHQGCNSRKNSGEHDLIPAKTVRSNDFLIGKLYIDPLREATTLSGRARLYFENDGSGISADANLVVLRDSAIWMNVRKFGIETARLLIRPDSIIVLSRLENTYYIWSWNQIRQQYGIPGGYNLLQSALFGTAWLRDEIQLESGIRDSLHRLYGADSRLAVDYRLEEQVFRLRQQSFIERINQRNLVISNAQFKKVENSVYFAYLRTLEAFDAEHGKLRLELEFEDVEINTPKTFRFEIPAHYNRAE